MPANSISNGASSGYFARPMGSVMSCRKNLKSGSCNNGSMFMTVPESKLSMQITFTSESRARASQMCEPMNPAPPVTTTFFFLKTPLLFGIWLYSYVYASLISIFKCAEHRILRKINAELAEYADLGSPSPARTRDNLCCNILIHIADCEVGTPAERGFKREELGFHGAAWREYAHLGPAPVSCGSNDFQLPVAIYVSDRNIEASVEEFRIRKPGCFPTPQFIKNLDQRQRAASS